jgi:hypothetical protein
MKLLCYLIPRSLWTRSSQTNVGGEVSEGCIFQVEIGNVIYMTPTLLHLPCSYAISVYRMRHMLHEGGNYMSPYYSIYAELKTWEPRFEHVLDLS